MPNSVDGFPTSARNALMRALEGKAAGRIIKKAGHAIAGAASGVIIDSLGRRWNSSLHPRDSRGRFIETGGIARIGVTGKRGKVVRALGNGRVEVRLANGKRERVPAQQLTMIARPDGSKPIAAPDMDKNPLAFKKAISKINDEDERRIKNPKRGDGVDADDEGDWDGDGILNEHDDTPLGEKKPPKGKQRKGGKDAGHGYKLHSKPEGGESADINHELEDPEGNIVGTATSGIPSVNRAQGASWRGQVGGERVDAANEAGWVLSAKRAHVRQRRNAGQSARPAAASKAPEAPAARKPKAEITPAHREERDGLGEKGRTAYDLARHAGKNHVQAMGDGEAADRKHRDRDGEGADSRPVAFGKEKRESADRAEQVKRDEIEKHDRAVDTARNDERPEVQEAVRRYDDASQDNLLAKRKAAREVQAALGDGRDDENDKTRTGRPETDRAAERQSDAPNLLDNEDSTPNPKGETSERKPVRDDRGEVLADVPAESGGHDGEPDGVLPQPGRAGAGRDRLPVGERSGGRGEGGAAGDGDARGGDRGDSGSGEGSRGGRTERPRVLAAGAGDRGTPSRGAVSARVGDGDSRDGVDAPKGRSAARKNAAKATTRFKPGSQSDLAPQGEEAKLQANMAALRLLRKIQAEDRPATPSEQKVLARWSGWGALPGVFDEGEPKYAAVRDELEGLLSPREWDDARDNVLNAHYTDAELVKETWGALEAMGFTGGDVLEPGSGAGNFIGLAPDGARMTGIEVDPITAGISQLLYPDADIHQESFGDSPIRSGSFDAVVGNVPFGNFPVRDKKHNPGNRMSIHNHFIVKGIDALKPGGVMAVVTSQWTLDSPDDTHKRKIAEQADLIGAVRLPAGAHKAAAGTDVVTDVLLFRKRKDHEVPGDTSWMNTVGAVDKAGNPVMGIARKGQEPKQQQISSYFQSHPENMLGNLQSGGYNGHKLVAEGDTVGRLHERLGKIAKDAKDSGRRWDPNTETVAKRAAGSEGEGRIMFAGEVKDPKGKAAPKFTIVEDGQTVDLPVPESQSKQLRSLLELSDATRQLLDRESVAPEGDPVLEDYRKRLNRLYDDYVGEFGPITKYELHEQLDANGSPKLGADGEPLAPRRKVPPVMSLFRKDLVTSSEVFGLEKAYDPIEKTAKKSDLFEKRQINPNRVVASTADTPDEAVALLKEQGKDLSWANLAEALDVPESKVKALAGDAVFEVPGGKGKIVHRAEYLSDNVRQKLEEARRAAETDPSMERNVKALEAVVPEDADLSEMPLQLGADWIDPAIITEFGRHLMKQGPNGMKVSKDYVGAWKVERPASGSYNRNGSLEMERWGTERRPFYDLLLAVLKQQHRGLNVYDTHPDGTKTLNKEETEAAREKALEIAAEFENFAFSDAGIADRLSKAYSERFRAIVPRSYDGSPRRAMPGMTGDIKLLPHQNDAVTRGVSEPAVLFEHVVGAGKTFTLAGTIMELRRLGLAKKPVLAVPNHMLAQWVGEFKELYPNAKILAADSDVLEGKDGRRRFAALARNNDWDVVLMTHTAFESIPVSKDKYEAYMSKELDVLRGALTKAKLDGNTRSFKQIQTQIKKKEAKLAAQLEKRKDDDGITFEHIGFDYIAADEAHVYKNLDFNTSMDGVASPEGSGRARDMHMKLEVARGDDPTKHVAAFATGTPISNSLSEMYTMMRFLRPDLLEAANIADFDSWAATFAKVESKLETNTAGNGYVERTRMRGFTDALGDGLRMWRTFSDTKTIEDLPWIKRPAIKGGERQVHVVEQSDLHVQAMGAFKSRVNNLPSGRAKKGDDTHVAIIGDGRRAAIDPRLMSERGLMEAGIDLDEDDFEVAPKIAASANRIADIYAATRKNQYLVRPLKHDEVDGDVPMSETLGALQMVMCDSSAPSKGKLNAYQMLKDELVARGIPEDSIRFIQDYKTADQKAKLFEDARQGKVAVLMGSTAALGTGTNVQNRLYALHHLDGSWKPSDIEQREGRILRQGNQNADVEIHVYATKGTHDIKTWDMTAYKQHVLDAMKQGDFDMRGVEFADDVDPLTDFDTISGMASENPLVADRRDVEAALKKLQKSAGRHAQQVELANSRAEKLRVASAINRRNAAELATQLAKREDIKGDAFKIKVHKDQYGRLSEELTDRKKAAAALQEKLLESIDGRLWAAEGQEQYEHTLGYIGGFPVRYFRKKGVGGKPVGILRLGKAGDPAYNSSTIPTKPVEFSKTDVRDNMAGILQRLENRVTSMEDEIKGYELEAGRLDNEAKESAANALRDFAGAQELMDAQNRKALLDKMLQVDEEAGQKIDPADMREYERLNRVAAEREAAEKAQRAAALAAKKAERSGAKQTKVQATDSEKESSQRDLAEAVKKARGERRPSAPKTEGEATEAAQPKGRQRDDAPATEKVDADEVQETFAELGMPEQAPKATPAKPKRDDAPEASVTGPDEFETRRGDREALDGVDDPGTRNAMELDNAKRAEEARRRDEVEAADEGGEPVTVREAEEAYDFLGAEEADGILGDGGLSGATPAAMRELVRRAEEERAKEAADKVAVDPEQVRADAEATGNADVIDLASRRPSAPSDRGPRDTGAVSAPAAPTSGSAPTAPAPAADAPAPRPWTSGWSMPRNANGTAFVTHSHDGKRRVSSGPVYDREGQFGTVNSAGNRSTATHADGTVFTGNTGVEAFDKMEGYHYGRIDRDGNVVVPEITDRHRGIAAEYEANGMSGVKEKFGDDAVGEVTDALQRMKAEADAAAQRPSAPAAPAAGESSAHKPSKWKVGPFVFGELRFRQETLASDGYDDPGFTLKGKDRLEVHNPAVALDQLDNLLEVRDDEDFDTFSERAKTKALRDLRNKIQAQYPDVEATPADKAQKQERDTTPSAPPAPTAEGSNVPPAPTNAPDEDGLVESVNEGQLEGQTRLGGEDFRTEITEDWMKTEEVAAPKPKPEPKAPEQDGPSLFDEPAADDAPAMPEARARFLNAMAEDERAYLEKTLRQSASSDASKDHQEIARKWVAGEELTADEARSWAGVFDAAADIADVQGKPEEARRARAAAAAMRAEAPGVDGPRLVSVKDTTPGGSKLGPTVTPGRWEDDQHIIRKVDPTEHGGEGPVQWQMFAKNEDGSEGEWMQTYGSRKDAVDAVSRMKADAAFAKTREEALSGRSDALTAGDGEWADVNATALKEGDVILFPGQDKPVWVTADPKPTRDTEGNVDGVGVWTKPLGGYPTRLHFRDGDAAKVSREHAKRVDGGNADEPTKAEWAKVEAAAPGTPEAPAPAKPGDATRKAIKEARAKKPSKLDELTEHETYGEVSKRELRAIKKHNVSLSDHMELRDAFGDDHAAITEAITDPAHHMSDGTSFSSYKFQKGRTEGGSSILKPLNDSDPFGVAAEVGEWNPDAHPSVKWGALSVLAEKQRKKIGDDAADALFQMGSLTLGDDSRKKGAADATKDRDAMVDRLEKLSEWMRGQGETDLTDRADAYIAGYREARAAKGDVTPDAGGAGRGGDKTPDAPSTPEPMEPNDESRAVEAVTDFEDLHGTIREGMESTRLGHMLQEDIAGAPLTPGEYRDLLDDVIAEAERRLANTRTTLASGHRSLEHPATRRAWTEEQEDYLHDIPLLRAAREKAAALADGWVDPTPEETNRLRAARAARKVKVSPDDVTWTKDRAGNPVGEIDGHRVEVRKGKVGVNQKVHLRSIDRDGIDRSNEYWAKTGMIPNGAKTKAEAEEMVKASMTRDLDSMVDRDRIKELNEAEEAYKAARGGARTIDAPSREDVPDPEDAELPDTAEDLNVVPDPEPISVPNAPERLPGEKFDPTPQQQQVYDAVANGKDVVIQAKAGAGKTSTLEGLARRIERDNPDDRIAYIAFNKSVQVEAAGRMPRNTEPRTGHSIAFAWASDDLKDRFDRRGLRRPDEIARHLGINDEMKVPGEKALSPKEQAMGIVRAIDTFANSADDEISAKHLPERLQNLPQAEQDALVAFAKKGWKDLLDAKGGKMNMTLDHIRKMWALSKPDFTKAGSGLKRRATVLFLDEAQDTPPVLAKVIADQKMRKVIVGDADQAIYGFTGATDYLSTALSDVELPLTKSFRFGPQVAAWGNRFLQLLNSKGRVEGAGPASKIVHDMQDADAILVRSNGGMIGELMKELEKGRTVGVPKGTKKDLLSLVETARYLKGEGPMPERMHDDLAPFRTWAEVADEAQKGDDAKIKMLARIVGEHGVDKLDELVQQVTELGDDGLAGVEFENHGHGLVAKGKTFGVKDTLKDAGFRWMEVPGEKIEHGKNKGQPLKAWTATGTDEQREAKLARVREALAGPEPDVVVSTAHKSKGLEWDRVKIGDDFQGPKKDPNTGKTILPDADENRLAYVAVTRAQKELDPGSLAWVEDYTDENGGTPGKAPAVKVDADEVAKDLAEIGAEAPKVDAPKAPEAPNAAAEGFESVDIDSTDAMPGDVLPNGRVVSMVFPGEGGEDGQTPGTWVRSRRKDQPESDFGYDQWFVPEGTKDPITVQRPVGQPAADAPKAPEEPKVDVPAKPVERDPNLGSPVAPSAANRPTGDVDAPREQALDKHGRAGADKLRVGDVINAKRTDTGEHEDISVESVEERGNGMFLVTGRDKDGNRVFARINHHGAKMVTPAPEGTEDAWHREVAPESIEKPGPTLPGDLRVGDKIKAKLPIGNTGRKGETTVTVTQVGGKSGFMRELKVEDAHGKSHWIKVVDNNPVTVTERAPKPLRDQTDSDLLKALREENAKGADANPLVLDRLEEEIDRRDKARSDRYETGDWQGMSDAELEDAVARASAESKAGNADAGDKLLAILDEVNAREEHAQQWGAPSGPRKPEPELTKAEQEQKWLSELEDHNRAILDRIARESDTVDVDGEVDGIELFGPLNTPKPGLTQTEITTLLQGKGIQANRLAKALPEESTLAIWGMSPDELRKEGVTRKHLRDHGAIDRDAWLDDKRRGGSGLGESDHADNDRDRLRDHDPVDLHDGELEDELHRAKQDGDDDRERELLAEKVERNRKDRDQRDRDEQERRERREQDERDDKDVPEGDVRDLDDKELNDRIKDGEDDDEESRKARGEKHRRERLSDEEKEKEDEERRRRRHRRDRRRRRRNRRNRGGGHNRPHLPHLPHLPNNRDDEHGNDEDRNPRVPGDRDAVEKALGKGDAAAEDAAAAAKGVDTTRDGRDMTPEERAADNAAIEEAYGDPATDLDAFVAAEDLPEGGKPGTGTVGGATRDEADVIPLNEDAFNAALKAMGEPVDGQQVVDANSLRRVLGKPHAEALLAGRGVPAHRAYDRLSEADARVLFGMGRDDLKALDPWQKVKWAGARTPEKAVAPHAPKKAAPAAPKVDAPKAPALPTRDEALANPDERGWSAPMNPADVKAGDVVILPGIKGAGVVKEAHPQTFRGEPGANIYTDGGNAGWIGESTPVRVLAQRALDGKTGRLTKAQRDELSESAKLTQEADAKVKRDAAAAAGPLPETDADGYYPPAGDPAELPVGPYGLDAGQTEALVRMKLSDEPLLVSGVTKDGTPFMGTPVGFHMGVVGGEGELPIVKIEGPNGDQFVPGPHVASMRLIAGEVAMPAAEPVLATRLRPGSRATMQDRGRSSLWQGPGKRVEVDPDGSMHMANGKERGPGARSTLGTPDNPRTAYPLERYVGSPAPVEGAREDAPEVDAPAADAPRANVPGAVEPGTASTADAPAAPAEPGTPATPERPAEPAVPGAGAGGSEADAPAVDAPARPSTPEDSAPREKATVRIEDKVDDLPTATEPITGRKPDWVTPDALQIGDFALIDGHDSEGNPLKVSGYLANDPQPAEFQPVQGDAYPVLGMLLGSELDGLGEQTMVWAPLDRMAALAPRPESEDVVPEGEQLAQNKLDVANGRMPKRIPTDSTGKLGLFPRTLVKDVDGQREGVVIAARGEDVSVRWGDDNVEDVAGHTLTVTDKGIQRPDGWSRDGRQFGTGTPGRRGPLSTPDPAQQKPIEVDKAVQDELMQVATGETDDLIEKIGKALDGSKPMSRAEFERTLQGIVRKHMKESEARRVQAARRIVAQRPYEAGLLTKVIAALGLLALSIAAAIVAALAWLFDQNNRQWAKEHLGLAARTVSRKAKNLPEFERLNKLLGIKDAREVGGLDQLEDMMG